MILSVCLVGVSGCFYSTGVFILLSGVVLHKPPEPSPCCLKVFGRCFLEVFLTPIL